MIDAAWKRYRDQVIPANAPEVQIQETQRGFYAGALIVWNALLSLDRDDEATPADIAKLDQLKAELDRYAGEIIARGASGESS